MSKPPADDLGVNALCEHHSGVGVSKSLKREMWNVGLSTILRNLMWG